MKDKEYLVGIHLNLPRDIEKKISVHKKDRLFYPGNYKTLPHITLYIARFKKQKFGKLYEELSIKNFQSFKIKLGLVKSIYRHKEFFLYLNIFKTKPIIDFHQKVVMISNKLRGDLIRRKDLLRVKEGLYSDKEVEQIKKYGYLRVLKYFEPHITLGIVGTGIDLEKLKNRLKINYHSIINKSFRVNYFTIGLYLYDYDKEDFDRKYTIEKKIKLL